MTILFNVLTSFVSGLIASILGVLITIKYENCRRTKEKKELQNRQWKSMNEIMYSVRDWAEMLMHDPTSQYPNKYISPHALFNKLSCDEIPIEYRDYVFQMACAIIEIQYELSLQKPDLEIIKVEAKLIYTIAKDLAKKPNPDLFKNV